MSDNIHPGQVGPSIDAAQFDEQGNGPSETTVAAFVSGAHVGLRVRGVGGPLLTPDGAERLAGALIEAAGQLRYPGAFDRFIRQPMQRALLASETRCADLEAEVGRLRGALGVIRQMAVARDISRYRTSIAKFASAALPPPSPAVSRGEDER